MTMLNGGRSLFGNKVGLDFYNIHHGKCVTFNTKETENKTSFLLKNVKHHQYDIVICTIKHNGLVSFNYYGDKY